MATKTRPGNFFEDFRVGATLVHATPRTVTEGDLALYQGLFGSRFALQSSTPFAQAMGYTRAPVDDLLAFHLVFGKTVPDVSLNAIANLGYAGGVFGEPVYPGDTITTTSQVTGVKENKDGKTGVVYVHSTGVNQRGAMVVDYHRWVMVRKRDVSAPAPTPIVPELPAMVPVSTLMLPPVPVGTYDTALAGSADLWDDYAVGERIDHVDAMTVEDAEHQMAARLYQNTAKVHFNLHVEREGRFGKRIVYGGYVISLARALSFNGLANAQRIVAIHGGRHVNPTFAGDTIYAWSEITGMESVPGRSDVGILRVRTIATKDLACHDFPAKDETGAYLSAVVLDFDYSVAMPRR
jgi:2-methylfumaryl-CoA hydratase